jgi:hypothetical protein
MALGGLVLLVLKKFPNAKKKIKPVVDKLFFNGLIKAVMASYLPFAIIARFGSKFSSDSDKSISNDYAYMSVCIIVLGTTLLFNLFVDNKELEAKNVSARFGVIYEDTRY